MDTEAGKTTYYVYETAAKGNKQIIVTTDRRLVDKIIIAWVEEAAGEPEATSPSKS